MRNTATARSTRYAVGCLIIGAIYLTPIHANAANKGFAGHPVQELSQFTNCDSHGQPIDKHLTIAFAETDLNSPWRISELHNFKFWAKKLCVPHFVWNQANESVTRELSNVSDLLSQHPNVLILDPEATKPLTPAVGMAAKAGIPLVVADRTVDATPGTKTYKTFIGANQFKIGYQSAEWWIKKLKRAQHTDHPKADLAIIMGGVGQQPAIARDKGVEAAIRPYPGIKIVAKQSGDWTLAGGRSVMEAYLQRFKPGELQGVFAASDEMLAGARQAMKAAGRHDLAGWFFSGDGQLVGLKAVTSKFDVADTQNPPFYGRPSLEAAIALADGKHIHRYYMLKNRTFTCMTKKLCTAAESYVSKIEFEGLRF